jgi:hypothetical protein
MEHAIDAALAERGVTVLRWTDPNEPDIKFMYNHGFKAGVTGERVAKIMCKRYATERDKLGDRIRVRKPDWDLKPGTVLAEAMWCERPLGERIIRELYYNVLGD